MFLTAVLCFIAGLILMLLGLTSISHVVFFIGVILVALKILSFIAIAALEASFIEHPLTRFFIIALLLSILGIIAAMALPILPLTPEQFNDTKYLIWKIDGILWRATGISILVRMFISIFRRFWD